ncbi:MAG: hypothetical protein AAGC60_29245 [Acidobacteriota bacterium]
MTALFAFLAYEWRAQLRSLRFGGLGALYVGLAALPGLVTTAHARRVPHFVDASAWAAEVLVYLPLLSFLLALVLAAEAAVRERTDGTWPTLSINPLSSAGYMIRRFLAVLSVVLPLTTLPLGIAAILAVTHGAPMTTPGSFVWPWLLVIVPVTVSGAAIGFGAATITGGFLGGLGLAALAGAGFFPLVRQTLVPWRLSLAGPTDWLGLDDIELQIRRLALSLRALSSAEGSDGLVGGFPILPMATSSAPIDAPLMLRESLHAGAGTLALSLVGLGLAVAYLRRTVPDIDPPRVRAGHPLRTLLLLLSRLRARYSPDASLSRLDRGLLGLCMVLAVVGLGMHWLRGQQVLELAARKVALEESEWPPPTSPGLVPGSWRLEGTLDGRSVDVALEAEMVQSRGEPAGRQITWVIDRGLDLVELAADRPLEVHERRLDRLSIVLAESLDPGDSVRLSLRLAGIPTRLVLPPRRLVWRAPELHSWFSKQRHARFPRDLQDPALALDLPSISAARIELAAGELLPSPRYTPFGFIPFEPGVDLGGPVQENHFPPADLEIELRMLQTALLADACGAMTTPNEPVLHSACVLSPARYLVAGGPHRPITSVTLRGALLPGHERPAKAYLSALADAQGLLDQILPGGEALAESTFLDWPAPPGRREWARWQPWARFELGGQQRILVDHRLVRIPEDYLLSGKELGATDLVAPLLESRLKGLRFDSDQQLLPRNLLLEVVRQLAGRVPEKGAVLGPARLGAETFRQSAIDEPSYSPYWTQRWSALVVDLRHRVGDEALRRTLFEGLDDEDAAGPRNLDHLVAALSGPRLAEFADQLVRNDALPVLSLGDVTVARRGDSWSVSGRIVNAGDGHAVCPVRIATEGTPVNVTVDIDQEAAFQVVTQQRPRLVLLDPDGRCFRYRASRVARERIDLAVVGGA